MSTFDEASLVFIPSGYKTSKAYSVKPTDGTGDLTFTRSNDTATRVGPDGLIEKVRTNRYLYSEQFDNAAWTKQNASVTANASTAPNGTTTADKIIPDTTTNYHPVGQGLTGGVSGAEYAFSIYAKADGYNFLLLNTSAGAATNAGPVVDLSNGTVVANLGGTDYGTQVTSVGSGWYRISFSYTTNATSTTIDVNILPTSTIAVYTGNGTSGVLLWGAQYEAGVATDYIATTSAAVSVGPVANVPRLDYLNSSCGRLLLEPQRTNLVSNSENISGSNWTNVDSTDSINVTATLDPSGYYGADKLQETTANAAHVIAFQSGLMSSANTYTFSSFLKAAERNWVAVYIYNGTSSFTAYFNLATGVKGSVTSGATSAIESYGNGWYRCSITLAVAGSALANGGVITATADGTISYAGTNGSGIYVWGCQLEAGAYATSYIPTLGAAVTRGADAASKTGISSLIGQTEGTIFVEFNRSQDKGGAKDFFIASLSAAGSSSNRIYLVLRASTEASFPKSLELGMVNGGVLQFNYLGTTVNAGTHKLALAYKANDLAVYFDGVQIATDSSCTVPAMDKFTLGIRENDNTATTFDDTFGQALLFPTRLSNDSLAALTA